MQNAYQGAVSIRVNILQTFPSPPSLPFFIPFLHLPHISLWQRLMTVLNEVTFFLSSFYLRDAVSDDTL